MTSEQVWNEAKQAAQRAAEIENAKLGPESRRGFDCGFAWVVIRPARGKFVTYLKSIDAGKRGYYGGFEIWYSKLHNIPTQSISVHEAAARAAAQVFADRLGIAATMNSRLD